MTARGTVEEKIFAPQHRQHALTDRLVEREKNEFLLEPLLLQQNREPAGICIFVLPRHWQPPQWRLPMMKSKSPGRGFLVAGTTLLLLALTPRHAVAALLIFISQSGPNVVVSGSGTLNITSLTQVSAEPTPVPQFFPTNGTLTVGTAGTTYYSGFSGPASFGTGSNSGASNPTGGFVGLAAPSGTSRYLAVPSGYVSGAQITDSETFANTTLAGLGFTPGNYTFAWGTGANADSLTITSLVPEPSTWALLAVGTGMLGLAARRRSSRPRAA